MAENNRRFHRLRDRFHPYANLNNLNNRIKNLTAALNINTTQPIEPTQPQNEDSRKNITINQNHISKRENQPTGSLSLNGYVFNYYQQTDRWMSGRKHHRFQQVDAQRITESSQASSSCTNPFQPVNDESGKDKDISSVEFSSKDKTMPSNSTQSGASPDNPENSNSSSSNENSNSPNHNKNNDSSHSIHSNSNNGKNTVNEDNDKNNENNSSETKSSNETKSTGTIDDAKNASTNTEYKNEDKPRYRYYLTSKSLPSETPFIVKGTQNSNIMTKRKVLTGWRTTFGIYEVEGFKFKITESRSMNGWLTIKENRKLELKLSDFLNGIINYRLDVVESKLIFDVQILNQYFEVEFMIPNHAIQQCELNIDPDGKFFLKFDK